MRRGRRAGAGLLTVTWMEDRLPPPPRVAYAVGRRVGPAVRRNRLRRRLRSVVRHEAHRLGPGAYLVGAAPGAADVTFAELLSMYRQALDRLGLAGATGNASPASSPAEGDRRG